MEEQKIRRLDERLEQLFGTTDFAQLKGFKQWYDGNKNKSQIIAYLKG